MESIKDYSFYQIQGWMRKLGLKGIKLQVFALINGFSQEGQGMFIGSLSYIALLIGTSRSTIIRAIRELELQELIEKKSVEFNGQTTNAYCVRGGVKMELPTTIGGWCQNDTRGGVKMTLPQLSKDNLNNNSNNNKKEMYKEKDFDTTLETTIPTTINTYFLPSKVANDKFVEYLEARKSFGGNATTKKISEYLNYLTPFSDEEQIEILEDAINTHKLTLGIFNRPDVREVQEYINELGYTFEANDFLIYCDKCKWKTKQGKPISDWRAFLRVRANAIVQKQWFADATSDLKPKAKQVIKNEPKAVISDLTRFVKPTIEEIQNYCLSRRNRIDAEKFFDYYESKGWVVGKSKMKDWKAAVRTWEGNNKKSQPKEVKDTSNFSMFNV